MSVDSRKVEVYVLELFHYFEFMYTSDVMLPVSEIRELRGDYYADLYVEFLETKREENPEGIKNLIDE